MIRLKSIRSHAPLIGVVLLILVIAAPTLTYPLGRDQGEFATIGRGLLDGRVPYLDLWNPKPPAVFYVYAGAMTLFGRTVPALRSIDLLMFPVIAVCLYWIGCKVASARVGVWSALLFGVFYFTETFWTLTQNDGIALIPMCLAAVCAIKGIEGTTYAWRWAFLCGLLCGWAFWFKYPFALFAAALVIGVLWIGRPRLRDALTFAAGALIVVIGGAAIMAQMGAWEALVESASVTAGYTALGFTSDAFIAAFRLTWETRWLHWGGLMVGAGLFPVLSIPIPSPPAPLSHAERGEGEKARASAANAVVKGTKGNAEQNLTSFPEFGVGWVSPTQLGDTNPRLWRIIFLWLIATLFILMVQGKGYDYHVLPMLPPLVLFSAGSLSAILAWVNARTGQMVQSAIGAVLIGGLMIVIGAKTFPYLTGQEDETAYLRRHQAGEFVADESTQVAALLRERVISGDSLFIWGFRPEVYYLSGLNPATRFIFHFPLVADWYPTAWRDETVETLWAALPPYVLVLQADYLDWVTGLENTDSATFLQSYPALSDWLIYNYVRDSQIGNFLVWRRKTLSD